MRFPKRTAAAALAAAMLLPGCASNGEPSGMGIGAVLGGLAGAGIGRAIGNNSGSKVHGTWAGAAVGTVIGGLAGALVDEKERAPRHTTAPVDLDLAPMEPVWGPPARPAPVVRETRVVVEEDLPPIPAPRTTRTVTTTTTTRTTTTVRRTVPGTVVERVVIVE